MSDANPLSFLSDPKPMERLSEADLKPRIKRRKLWELDVHWHCAVIGTCLNASDIEKIAQKCQAPNFEGRIADYKMHSFFVGQARYSQGVGKLLHKFLERKFNRTVKAFSRLKTSALIEEKWLEAVGNGDIPGAFWAVMTHPNASSDLLSEVYGEVHMLSHLEGATNRADHRELADIKTTCAKLQLELEDVRRTNRKAIEKRDHLIGQLKRDLKDTSTKARRSDELEALLLAERDGDTIARLEKRIDVLTMRVLQETERADQNQQKLKELEAWNKELRQSQIATPVQEQAVTVCMQQEGCAGEESDLCGRCIAYIGGQTKQAAHFRKKVEEKNGQFIHHDGGLHDGQARLQSILSQADAVMFPVTCVSHEATREIKRVCIKDEKPFVPLRSQGLSAFVKGLEETIEKM
ncbi:DUF2325 domain-containing protein [Terasakiella sp. A23]|uniref:DUF2325 domain-containing protein n=1 Tax=Terasakiella sp. FCG-A23 TaxID=3080561 RepID=UPI002952BFF2|nr:DUF2325 domain-containing protein [Terasakiella sp. A23]MDV7339227.1 DUF2325 domain-containing protein [Terasakiella sp. A23]